MAVDHALIEDFRDGTPRVLDTVLAIDTPEQISFTYRVAGPWVRAAAYLIDTLVKAGILTVLAVGLGVLGVAVGNAAMGAVLAITFAVDWFYGAGFEAWTGGRTPGKRAMGLRAVTVDGLPCPAVSAVVRNFLRAADWLPAGFAAGVITMACGPRLQRLGDLAAGTLVVYEHDTRRPPRTTSPLERTPVDGSWQLTKAAQLSASVHRALSSYVAARAGFTEARRQELAAPLASSLARSWSMTHPGDPDAFLVAAHQAAAAESPSEART